MTITPQPVQQLPAAESVENEDYVLIFKNADGKARKALATLFKGADATINGVKAATIAAGENVAIAQDGATFTLSANATVTNAQITQAVSDAWDAVFEGGD